MIGTKVATLYDRNSNSVLGVVDYVDFYIYASQTAMECYGDSQDGTMRQDAMECKLPRFFSLRAKPQSERDISPATVGIAGGYL
ncbi:MAG: hypothetical protein Tsb009_05850 [Planctomycetaceae bacterium]